MVSPELEEFAKALVEHVRDMSVRSCDLALSPHAKGPTAKRWRELGAPASVVGPDVVDTTIFYLLYAIESGALPLKFVSSGGKEIDLAEAAPGELAGWYQGGDGWCGKYTQERYSDDGAELRNWRLPTWDPPADKDP